MLLIWLIVWLIVGTPLVDFDPLNAWAISLIVCGVLTLITPTVVYNRR